MNKHLICSIECLCDYMERHFNPDIWAIADIWYVELELHFNKKIDYKKAGW